jgi:oxygen-dependent protoporphyrinogen oxidase
MSSPRRIAVIGGGIAGLAAAHRIVEIGTNCEVTLFEAAPRLGGVLSTVRENGFQIERSADNFITTVPWAVNLCHRLGLDDQLIGTNPKLRRTFVVRGGKLHRLPEGFLMMAPTQMWPLAVTPILGPLGKIRAAMEYFIPPRKDDADESMAAFIRRRLGREAFERLVEPLISSIHASDLEKLSVLATLPRFREMEREYGSLIRAMRRQMKNRSRTTAESGARYSMFVTLRDGLSSLVDAIAARLPPGSVRLNSPVERIERCSNGWQVWTREGILGDLETWRLGDSGANRIPSPSLPVSQSRSLTCSASVFDFLILAAPSPNAASLLRPVDAAMAADVAAIPHSGTAIVSLGYRTEQIGHPIDGMGAVVPAVEKSPILAISFSSQKYPHRAPEGHALLRVFAGGARRPELASMPDAELLPLVLEGLVRMLKIRGEPCYCDVAHWPGVMPQYHVGHKDLVARIEQRAASLGGLALVGNAYRGVGIPECIHNAESAAEQAVQHIGNRQ